MAQDEKMLVPVELLARCAAFLEDPKTEHPHDVSYLTEELRALSAAPAQPATDMAETLRGQLNDKSRRLRPLPAAPTGDAK